MGETERPCLTLTRIREAFTQIKLYQDHIHYASLFTNGKLKKYNIPDDKWVEWDIQRISY